MSDAKVQYAHVLLFACPQCDRPLASVCYNTKLSLEEADANRFSPHCHCGWTGSVTGISALKHWVEPWPYHPPVDKDAEGVCEHYEAAHPAR